MKALIAVLACAAVSVLSASACWSDLDEISKKLGNKVNFAGEKVTSTAGGVSFRMAFVPGGRIFPTGTDNKGTAIVPNAYWMGETEVTNALFAAVLQWAYDNGKFSANVADHNGLNATTAKYGTQELIVLTTVAPMRISYSAGTFSVAADIENNPVTYVSWYGAIMFCNWLTEMRDGNTGNVAYTGIDASWDHSDTIEDAAKTGYRLPSSEEWEYAARFIGTIAPSVGNLASEYIAQNVNGGHTDLTPGHYWTPGNYASGATKDYKNVTETRAAAWYGGSTLMPVAQKTANQLGLYDMSGNVLEWCFTLYGSDRVFRSGRYIDIIDNMQIGLSDHDLPTEEGPHLGFRFVRTR